MKKTSRRLLSSLLIICLVGTLFPASVFAEGEADTQEAGVQISASMKDPITVKGGEETDPEVSDALEISNLDFTIERDYEQPCMLTVENVSSTAKEFYLEVTNNYSDLSMEIIKNGSKEDPTFVAAGQSVEVELSVFAQNAENENYIIPVTAYVLSASGEYEEAFTDTIDLTCKLPSLDLSWELMQSNDSTLKQFYKVSNEGETLTDLTITASDELKDYLNFSPFVTNYQLDANDDVQFEVWPDLAKMKNNNVSKLSGQLIASCAGKTSTYDCTFDTKGQEITITTMGKLAQQQDGNPFTKFEIAEDSVTLNYGDGTAVTEDTNIDDILDENGMFDLSSTMDLDLGVENNFPVEISMNSTQVSEEDAAQYENKTEIIESEENNSITIKTYIVLTEEEYQQMLDEAKAEMASNNSLIEPTVTSRAISDSEKKGRVVVETVFEINECYEYGGYGSNTISFIGDMYSLGTELGDSFNAANDPRLTREDKAAYIGCSLMKTVLIGGRAAVSITNPVVGLGFSILTKPLDYLIDKMQEAIIADAYREPSGAAIYAAIGGSQCTNRGSIKSSFYVPEYERSSTTTTSMHATSRMYGDGYVNKDNTNYNIILNGESVGTTNNAGLTEVAIAEISTDKLQPGKTNTLTFDYDTDPGSHTVSTDTQITLLYKTAQSTPSESLIQSGGECALFL